MRIKRSVSLLSIVLGLLIVVSTFVPVKACVVNTASLSISNDCVGGEVKVNASPGATYSEPSWSWSNPYVLEEVPAGSVTVTWSEGTPLSMTLDYPKVNEPAECLVVLSHSYEVIYNNDCVGYSWGVSVEKGSFVANTPLSGTWNNIYVQETSPVPFISIVWDDGFAATYPLGQIVEPSSCLVVDGHEFLITPFVDCNGYSWNIGVTNGTFSTNDPLTGLWTKPYVLETSPNPTVNFSWADGYSASVILETIAEPTNCKENEPTPVPTSTPVPQKTGAGSASGLPLGTFLFGLGLMIVGGFGMIMVGKKES